MVREALLPARGLGAEQDQPGAAEGGHQRCRPAAAPRTYRLSGVRRAQQQQARAPALCCAPSRSRTWRMVRVGAPSRSRPCTSNTAAVAGMTTSRSVDGPGLRRDHPGRGGKGGPAGGRWKPTTAPRRRRGATSKSKMGGCRTETTPSGRWRKQCAKAWRSKPVRGRGGRATTPVALLARQRNRRLPRLACPFRWPCYIQLQRRARHRGQRGDVSAAVGHKRLLLAEPAERMSPGWSARLAGA